MKLNKYLNKILKELKEDVIEGNITKEEAHFKFDIGVDINMNVNDKSKNRVKFGVRMK